MTDEFVWPGIRRLLVTDSEKLDACGHLAIVVRSAWVLVTLSGVSGSGPER